MKIRIVEHVFPDSETYYTVQKKVLGLFWVSFISVCFSQHVGEHPKTFTSYDAALNATKSKLQNSVKKHKNYFYLSEKELIT